MSWIDCSLCKSFAQWFRRDTPEPVPNPMREEKMMNRLKDRPSFPSSKVPTLDQCQQSIREKAYSLWENAGYPESDGVQFWLQAEQELFGSPTGDGYRIYVVDELTETPTPKIVTVDGVEDDDDTPPAPAISVEQSDVGTVATSAE